MPNWSKKSKKAKKNAFYDKVGKIVDKRQKKLGVGSSVDPDDKNPYRSVARGKENYDSGVMDFNDPAIRRASGNKGGKVKAHRRSVKGKGNTGVRSHSRKKK